MPAPEILLPDSRPPVSDEVDRQLIAALQINARESVAMLARQLGIARTTVTSRLAAWRRDPGHHGLRRTPGPARDRRRPAGLCRDQGAATLRQGGGAPPEWHGPGPAAVCVSGEFDYVAWLRTESPSNWTSCWIRSAASMASDKTTTSIILSSKIDSRAPLPGNAHVQALRQYESRFRHLLKTIHNDDSLRLIYDFHAL